MKLVCLGAIPEAVRIIHKIQEFDDSFEFVGFIDNDDLKWGSKVCSYPVFGGMSKVKELSDKGCVFCNLVTRDGINRYETTLKLLDNGAKLTNLIHPLVNLDLVEIGIGEYIQESVVLQANVSIGDNSSIHMGSLIGHETKIGNSVFIAHGCNISGAVTVEDGVFIGTGVSIIPKITIGKWSTIGAGSVIINNIPPHSVVVGNPGRIIKTLEKKYDTGEIRP